MRRLHGEAALPRLRRGALRAAGPAGAAAAAAAAAAASEVPAADPAAVPVAGGLSHAVVGLGACRGCQARAGEAQRGREGLAVGSEGLGSADLEARRL